MGTNWSGTNVEGEGRGLVRPEPSITMLGARLSWLTEIVTFLGHDVAVGDHVQSPMLSWIGAGGILALCVWHSMQLIRGQLRIRQALVRVHGQIARLVVERRKVSKDWVWIPALSKRPERSAASPSARRDLDDLYELDRVLRSEPDLITSWLSYRKTLGIEHLAWFLEPTVYSQRPAVEYFSFETLCANRLNINFYRQLPSVLTGIGLMLTFLAILIGLSKLHANGSQIEGIQGLINGLAGKFVTSVVGLACANMFGLLEHSVWHRLEKQHRACIALVDEMFPQKSTVQQTPPVSPVEGMVGAMVGHHARSDSMSPSLETVQQRLGATVTALTAASQSLATLTSAQSRVKLEDLAKDIGSEVQRTLRPVLDSLLGTLQNLNRSLNELHLSPQLPQSELEAMLTEFKHQQGAIAESSRRPRAAGKEKGRSGM